MSADTDDLRDLLRAARFTQRGAARALGIDERVMRSYAAGKTPIPPVVMYAMRYLAMHGGVPVMVRYQR